MLTFIILNSNHLNYRRSDKPFFAVVIAFQRNNANNCLVKSLN